MNKPSCKTYFPFWQDWCLWSRWAVAQWRRTPQVAALNMITQPDGSTTYSLSLQILALMTAVSLLPSLVLGMTSFTRIIIVLSILRQAMGTQQTPPNQVLIAIALFLSLFIMTPTLTAVYEEAVNPYVDQEIAAEEAMSTGSTL